MDISSAARIREVLTSRTRSKDIAAFDYWLTLFTPSFVNGELIRLRAILPAHGISKASAVDLRNEMLWSSAALAGCTFTKADAIRLLSSDQLPSCSDDGDSQILSNHQRAAALVEQKPDLTVETVEAFHSVLSDPGGVLIPRAELSNQEDLGVIRSSQILVLANTTYQPPNAWHGESDLTVQLLLADLMEAAAAEKDAFESAFYLLSSIPYVIPFLGGSQTVSRMLANAALYNAGEAMLSFEAMLGGAYTAAIQEIHEQRKTVRLARLFIEACIDSRLKHSARLRELEADLTAARESIYRYVKYGKADGLISRMLA